MQEGIQEKDSFDIRKKLEIIKLAGEMALESGAELSLVETVIRRMAAGFGMENMECLILPNGLLITCTGGTEAIYTTLRKVKNRGSDLNQLDLVNRISLEAENGKLGPVETGEALRKIKDGPPFPSPVVCAFGAAIASAGSIMMLHGRPVDMLISALMAFWIWCLLPFLNKIGIRGGSETMALSFLLAMAINIGSNLVGAGDKTTLVSGALLLLVPGMTMTTAVFEIVQGDMLNGIIKGLEALLGAILIMAGAFIAITIAGLIF